MINKKDIKNKKNSIKYIYKITKSMEIISILKYKYLYKKIKNNNKYIKIISKLINNVYFDNNIFIKENNNNFKNILYIVISTNQGLCGNLNTNLHNKIILDIKYNFFLKKKIYLFLWGKKNSLLLKNLKKLNIKFDLYKNKIYSYNILNYFKHNILNNIINFYISYPDSVIFIASNIFKKNKYIIDINQLLPIIKYNNTINIVNYIYEDNKNILHNDLLLTYIKSKINSYILNNIICEYFTRILVMKSASLNSENLFKKLDLTYNKVRQFNITKEIVELISNFNIL